MKRLKNKIAVITGAAPQSDGLGNGSAVALTFAKEGAKVILVNRSDKVLKLKRTIENNGFSCDVIKADVTKEKDVKKLFKKVSKRYGKLDILYNNVGGNIEHPQITKMDTTSWYKGLDFNLTSAMLCCKYAIPLMKKSKGASIINASSIAGIKGIEDEKSSLLTYSVAKSGLKGLMQTIAAEYSKDLIRINNIVIGMIETPLITNKQGEAVLKKRRKIIPLNIKGDAMDTAWAAVYLASDESKFVTGTEILIDGGQCNILKRPR